MAIPLHILALRRIASKISRQVYSPRPSQQDREAILESLHRDLIDWRRNMPFPLPDLHPQVPQMSSNWYDFNYYTHLAMLYRPSPFWPTLTPSQLNILGEAAAFAIRQGTSMHRQKRFAYNWLNLLAIFQSALSLVYAISARGVEAAAWLRSSMAVEDLVLVTELFETLSVKFPVARKLRELMQAIIAGYRNILAESELE